MVLGRADEGAAGLDDAAAAREPVVEHPAADAVAGLDDEHRAARAGDLARGDQAGDAAADDDHVDRARAASPGGVAGGGRRRAGAPVAERERRRAAPPSTVRR